MLRETLQEYENWILSCIGVASIELKSQPIHSKAILLNKKIH
jgi:hypothetical protein